MRIANRGRSVYEVQGMSVERNLTAAQGYLELDMPEEALEELNQLPSDLHSHNEILQLRLVVLMRLKNWTEALALCEQLQARFPQLTTGFIHAAFCLHELGKTGEARQVLLGGPSALLREPTYHYNLGCYEAVLGNHDAAVEYLRASFSMDPHFRDIAKRDPDLQVLAGLL